MGSFGMDACCISESGFAHVPVAHSSQTRRPWSMSFSSRYWSSLFILSLVCGNIISMIGHFSSRMRWLIGMHLNSTRTYVGRRG